MVARVRYVNEAAQDQRLDSAKEHVWSWLAASEIDVFDFHVTIVGQQRRITPDDAETAAKVHMLVQELAQLMVDFSFFPYPPER